MTVRLTPEERKQLEDLAKGLGLSASDVMRQLVRRAHAGSGGPTQREYRRGVDVGGGLHQVTTAAEWYKAKHFASEAEARGAFKLAHQQALDGMGTSKAAWMGLTAAQFDAWMRDDALPGRRPVKKGGK